ncbi:hypothetical protein D3C80_729560 [compost metagenome]
MSAGEVPADVHVRQDVVELNFTRVRLDVFNRTTARVATCEAHGAVGVRDFILSRTDNRAALGLRVAVLVHLALEEGRTNADVDAQRVFQEATGVFDSDLVQDGVGQAVTRTDFITVQVDDAVFLVAQAGEGIEEARLGRVGEVDLAVQTRLTVTSVVQGVGTAQGLRVRQLPDQRRADAVTLGVGVIGRVNAHAVQDVAVAVQVNAARGLGAADRAIGFRQDELARTTGRQGVLERRVEGEDQTVTQGEARLCADVARVRRVLTQSPETVGVGVALSARNRIFVRIQARRGEIVLGVEVTVPGHPVGQAGRAVCVALQLQVRIVVVAVAVPVSGNRNKVAVVAQRLVNLEVVLGLVQVAPALELVIRLVRVGEPGRGAERTDFAGVQQSEDATEVVIAQRALDTTAEFRRWADRAHVDRTAGGGGRRGVDIGRAGVDRSAGDQVAVQLLVGVERIVARVVQRHAVEGLRDARAVKAVQTDVAARRAVGVVVGEAHARHEVQNFVDRLTGGLGLDELRRDRRARLADRFRNNGAVDGARAALAGDDDFADFNGGRTGRLGRSGAGHENAAHEGGRRPEQLFAVGHLSVSPVMKA